MIQTAIAATQFVADRREAGLPVATPDQLRRARRLIEGNPTIRHHHTPLGMQLLALRIPLSKREKIAQRVAEEWDDESQSFKQVEGIVLRPTITRTGDRSEVEASPAAVAAWVEANPGMTQLEAAQAIAGMHGYADLTPCVRRVERFTRSTSKTRIPRHLRDKMVCLSAIAQAAELIAERDAAAAAQVEAEGQADA